MRRLAVLAAFSIMGFCLLQPDSVLAARWHVAVDTIAIAPALGLGEL